MEYHKRKIRDDPDYRASCRDSQRIWREQNPEYMREYRKSRPDPRALRLEQLVELVKNNLAFDLRRCTAEAWIVIPKGAIAKNTFATAQLIVFDVVARDLPGADSEENILLALPKRNSYK